MCQMAGRFDRCFLHVLPVLECAVCGISVVARSSDGTLRSYSATGLTVVRTRSQIEIFFNLLWTIKLPESSLDLCQMVAGQAVAFVEIYSTTSAVTFVSAT